MTLTVSSRLALLLLLAIGAAPSARASPGTYTAALGQSRIVVNVFKKGLLSGVAHDHHFVPSDWRATARFDPAAPSDGRFEVVIAAGSLRDAQPDLSPKDRDKVNAQAVGPGVLDAGRYPEIRFSATSLRPSATKAAGPAEGAIDAVLPGTVTLHGRERPVSVPVRATRQGDGWRARGSVRMKQSDFGIEPYSGFLGTIAVEDELQVEFDLVMTPSS